VSYPKFESRTSWIKRQACQSPDRDVHSCLTTRFWVQLLYKRCYWVCSGLKQMSDWLQTNEPWHLTHTSGREFKLENSLSENVQRDPLLAVFLQSNEFRSLNHHVYPPSPPATVVFANNTVRISVGLLGCTEWKCVAVFLCPDFPGFVVRSAVLV
jgi:hypothetical protein